MNKTKLSSRTTTMMLMMSVGIFSILFISVISNEKNAEATICFDCPAEANKHLDEAKKSLDSGDIEGAKKHIDVAQRILNNSSTTTTK